MDGSFPSQTRAHEQPPAFAQLQAIEGASGTRLLVAGLLALGLHVAVGARALFGLNDVGEFARRVQNALADRARGDLQVEVEPEPPPPPPPEPEPPPPPEPEPPPVPAPPPPKAAPAPKAAEPPAPAAAQAGRVLAAEPTPDEPLDLTGNTFVQGNADYYAGGVTASKGTATQAVRNTAARPDGVVGGTGTAPASVDRSRAAGTLEKNWDCPFPAEAELEQINFQQVRVAVTVSAEGRALEVKVIGDTSFGFGRAAQRCALGKTFIPALNREGLPVTTTIPVVVTFVRR